MASEDHGELDKWYASDRTEIERGCLATQADDLKGLFRDYSDYLEPRQVDGSKGYLIPEQTYKYYDGAKRRRVNQTGFFMATKEELSKKNKYPKILGYLTLDSTDENSTFRLQIDTAEGTAIDLDTKQVFTDSEALNNIIDASRKGLELKKSDRQNRRRHAINSLIGATAGTAALVCGIIAADELVVIQPRARAERKAAYRTKFDGSGYKIPGQSNVLFADHQSAVPDTQFNKIPNYETGDSFKYARKFSIKEDSCRVFEVNVANSDNVYVGVPEGNNVSTPTIGVGTTATRQLYVCDLLKPSSKEKKEPTSEVAIQILPNTIN
jgi:hypothetical protein